MKDQLTPKPLPGRAPPKKVVCTRDSLLTDVWRMEALRILVFAQPAEHSPCVLESSFAALWQHVCAVPSLRFCCSAWTADEDMSASTCLIARRIAIVLLAEYEQDYCDSSDIGTLSVSDVSIHLSNVAVESDRFSA